MTLDPETAELLKQAHAGQDFTTIGLAGLIITQVFRTARELFRDKKRSARLERIEALAESAAKDSASCNRKLWRLLHPGLETPDPAEPRTVSERSPLR